MAKPLARPKLSHKNIWLHETLTGEGSFSHVHVEPEVIVDDLGALVIDQASWDEYIGDSHRFIVDASGTIVHSEVIDWDFWRLLEKMSNG